MTTSVLDAVLGVFTEVSTWIVETINSLVPMFYGPDGLTFLGVLALCGLAFSVIFLLISIIENFLHFRG